MSISGVVICGNERKHLAACLESLAWCDEIIVVDSWSDDGTFEIAERLATTAVRQEWLGYTGQKNYAMNLATSDWVLSLDADERCPPELRDEIRQVLADPGDAVGFEVRRHVFYLGRWIDHGGWYPDWKLRLVRRERARWEGELVHDRLEADGPVARLRGELHHFTYDDFSAQLRTVDRYTTLAAQELYQRGKRCHWPLLLLKPPIKFLECYVWKLGLLDGLPGFVIAVANAFYTFARLVKLWELEQGARLHPPASPAVEPDSPDHQAKDSP